MATVADLLDNLLLEQIFIKFDCHFSSSLSLVIGHSSFNIRVQCVIAYVTMLIPMGYDHFSEKL